MSKAGDVRDDVPMDVVDGIEDVQYALESLAEAIRCVRVAVASSTEDSTDFIEGTMLILLQAARSASSEATLLLRVIETHGKRCTICNAGCS